MNALREALLRGRRRPRYAGAGSPTLHRGDGYEFVELREYLPGDDIRRIDWAATARSGQLQTRIMLEDVALTLALVLDTSASMLAGRTRPLAQSAQEIAESWFGAASSSDRCSRVVSDDVVPPWAAPRNAAFSLRRALEVALAALPRGTALLVVSDFFELTERDELPARLGARCDCTAMIAQDPWQDDMPLSGFVRLRDAESGKAATVFLGRAERERYHRAVRMRHAALVEQLTLANWRTGTFDEDHGGAALVAAFGLQ